MKSGRSYSARFSSSCAPEVLAPQARAELDYHAEVGQVRQDQRRAALRGCAPRTLSASTLMKSAREVIRPTCSSPLTISTAAALGFVTVIEPMVALLSRRGRKPCPA